MVSEIEFSKGMEKEIRAHINDAVVLNIDNIWADALKRNKATKIKSPIFFPQGQTEADLEQFYLDFSITLHEFIQNELKKYEGDELLKIFKKKKSTAGIIADIEQKDERLAVQKKTTAEVVVDVKKQDALGIAVRKTKRS